MSKNEIIKGFSKLPRNEKIRVIREQMESDAALQPALDSFRHPDTTIQHTFEQFSENTISNYHLPYGIAPNFIIDEQLYHIPMVVEESSVVAAAAKSAKFWADKGGFRTAKLSTIKKGQVHFTWHGESLKISKLFEAFRPMLLQELKPHTRRMEQRGGGIMHVRLLDKNDVLPDYFQMDFDFETADSMGANFINTILEKAASLWQAFVSGKDLPAPEIIMAILSNYTPESCIKMQLRCPVNQLEDAAPEMSGAAFANKFHQAVQIAQNDVSRAVTHNKGIMNGSDAVILATGNDFRASGASVHAYAAHSGQYRSLTSAKIINGEFIYELNMALSLGTVGGLTQLHPLAKRSLEILNNPDARTLMKVVAAAGMANNFGAVRSLITTGIQQGHMKLHLDNMINALGADAKESQAIKNHFAGKTVSFADVKSYLNELRKQ